MMWIDEPSYNSLAADSKKRAVLTSASFEALTDYLYSDTKLSVSPPSLALHTSRYDSSILCAGAVDPVRTPSDLSLLETRSGLRTRALPAVLC